MSNRDKYPVIPLLEARSDFFCPAKWTELFLYLNHGTSNSCHHPIPHEIPAELLDNPMVLHNTPHKLEQQRLMIEGQRPTECHMCWHIEDISDDSISDRFIKSMKWKDDIATLQVDPTHIPKFIEVVFDNVCNLSCSYCDSGSSSIWANKISKDPLLLETDYRNLYSKVYITPGQSRPEYVDAWNKWWPQIRHTVEVLKISGGEPLLSKHFWKFLEGLGSAPQLSFSINSNLNVEPVWLDRLASHAGSLNSIRIAASIDSTDSIAEYVRQGLDFDLFKNNVVHWCETTPDNCYINLQSTINILSVWGLQKKLDLAVELRNRYPKKVVEFYSTLVRFPEFQSVTLLPDELKHGLAQQLSDWLSANTSALTTNEQSYVGKIVDYLSNDSKPLHQLEQDKLKLDLVKFLKYYSKSSQKNIEDVFPLAFINWLNQIKE